MTKNTVNRGLQPPVFRLLIDALLDILKLQNSKITHMCELLGYSSVLLLV